MIVATVHRTPVVRHKGNAIKAPCRKVREIVVRAQTKAHVPIVDLAQSGALAQKVKVVAIAAPVHDLKVLRVVLNVAQGRRGRAVIVIDAIVAEAAEVVVTARPEG